MDNNERVAEMRTRARLLVLEAITLVTDGVYDGAAAIERDRLNNVLDVAYDELREAGGVR